MRVIEEAIQAVRDAEEEFARQKRMQAERLEEEEKIRQKILSSSKTYSFEYPKVEIRNLVNHMNFSFRIEARNEDVLLPVHYGNAYKIIDDIEKKLSKQGKTAQLSIRGNQILTLQQYLSEITARPSFLGSLHIEHALDFVDELGTKYIERAQAEAQNPGRIKRIFRRK